MDFKNQKEFPEARNNAGQGNDAAPAVPLAEGEGPLDGSTDADQPTDPALPSAAPDPDLQTTVSASPEWSKPTAPPPLTAVKTDHPSSEGGLLSHPSENDPPVVTEQAFRDDPDDAEPADGTEALRKRLPRGCDEDEGDPGDGAANAPGEIPTEGC